MDDDPSQSPGDEVGYPNFFFGFMQMAYRTSAGLDPQISRDFAAGL